MFDSCRRRPRMGEWRKSGAGGRDGRPSRRRAFPQSPGKTRAPGPFRPPDGPPGGGHQYGVSPTGWFTYADRRGNRAAKYRP